MNMKKIILAVALLIGVCAACSDDKTGGAHSSSVAAPSDIVFERTGATEVHVGWKDNSDNETGFSIWVREAADASNRKIVGTVGPDVTGFTVSEGLVEGNSYFFGVQANAASPQNDSRVIYELYRLRPLGDLPSATVVAEPKGNATCIAASYRVANTAGDKNARWGLCWSVGITPTVADAVQYGPELPEDGSALSQVIPNALLKYGETYRIRAFVTASSETFYSKEFSASLMEAPAAISLQWNKLSKSTLPADIELYETTDKLNGKNFHAWYAVADVAKGNVELRVSVPDAAATIDDQAAAFGGDCYVMINGGYFYNGKNTGLSVVNSVAAGSIGAVRGSLKTSDTEEYASMYNVTRGLFGVDASGKPAVYWAGTDAGSKAYYYERPLPSVKGEAKYGVVSAVNPAAPVSWSPKYALSAGPVLLRDGKCPFDFTTTSKGADYYLSNYEVIPYDIFGPDVSPDRTAVGYREDGRIVLFICDGRIAASGGATLTELAQVMKGLGCVGAVNFDGGGSTGMVVGAEHLNDQTGGNRPVVSTIGFFKKK